jgi:hypothetical protein
MAPSCGRLYIISLTSSTWSRKKEAATRFQGLSWTCRAVLTRLSVKSAADSGSLQSRTKIKDDFDFGIYFGLFLSDKLRLVGLSQLDDTFGQKSAPHARDRMRVSNTQIATKKSRKIISELILSEPFSPPSTRHNLHSSEFMDQMSYNSECNERAHNSVPDFCNLLTVCDLCTVFSILERPRRL